MIGFGSHIQLVNFGSNLVRNGASQQEPIVAESVKSLEGIKHVEVFATKPGIIKTDEEMLGMVLKGVGADFDWRFFKENLVAGSILIMTVVLQTKY